MDIQEQILDLLTDCLRTDTFADCFLVELHCTANGQVTVYMDADSGMTLDRCRALSRSLEARIDETGLFDGKYALEVSSPGTDRPLTLRRQYPKHKGRTLSVILNDGSTHEGVVADVRDDQLYLTVSNGKDPEERAIPFATIKESFIQISFKK